MAKRRRINPNVGLPKAFRTKRKSKRTGQSRTAGETGAMGFQKYQGGTKPRFQAGAPTPIIVIKNPSNPSQGRIVGVGKKGGVYGRGGSNKSRWTDMDTIKKITGDAVPIMATIVAAGAGIQMLKQSKFGTDLAARAPGGMNTVVFGAGALTAYVAYKYRSFLLFMAGLGVGAYALMKLGTKEAKFSMTPGDEDGDGIIDSQVIDASEGGQSAAQPPKSSGPTLSASEVAANRAIDINLEGNKALKAGNFAKAAELYNQATRTRDDPAFLFNFAVAKHQLSLKQMTDGTLQSAVKDADIARLQYEIFSKRVRGGELSFIETKPRLLQMAQQADEAAQNIIDFVDIMREQARDSGDHGEARDPSFVPGRAGIEGDGYSATVSGEDDLDENGYPISGMAGSIFTG